MNNNIGLKMCATGRVTVWIIEPDGERRLVFQGKPNAVGADLIGRLHYYSSRKATSSPVTHVGLKYGTTTVYTGGIANTGPTAYSTTGYQWLSTGSWQNTTGAGVTMADLSLLNRDIPSTPLTYATLGSQSIAVGILATIEVQWTVILRQNSSGGTGFPVAFFSRMCQLFISATETNPLTTALYTANNAGTTSVAMGDPIFGGDVSSASVAWRMSTTAPAGAATLASITLYDDYSTPRICDVQSGFSDVWVVGTSLTDTATLTWAAI